MITYQNYKNIINGKGWDVDGAPANDPIQCVDIIKKFHYDYLGMKAYALGGTGYAREYWHRFDALGLGKFYKKVPLSQCKVGDIIIFENGAQDAPVSHVGFVDALPANGRVNVLGQNQPQKYVNVVSFSTNGVLGCLRLNEWDKAPAQKPENNLKYGVGTPVTVTGVWTASNGGNYVAAKNLKYGKGTYYIVKQYPGTAHPYALSNTKNGGVIGFVANKEIDEEPSKPNTGSTSASGEILNSIPSDFIRENATFYCSVDKINIRRAPTTRGALTGMYYAKGMSVRYDGYVKREGYVWISWISANTGNRHWMAAGELNSKGINAKPYGTFR